MTQHEAFLELAASAIDFELTIPEQEALDSHLRACAACLAVARDYRWAAAVLAALVARVEPLGPASSITRALWAPIRQPGRPGGGAPPRWTGHRG
jgi:hypothetical protein